MSLFVVPQNGYHLKCKTYSTYSTYSYDQERQTSFAAVLPRPPKPLQQKNVMTWFETIKKRRDGSKCCDGNIQRNTARTCLTFNKTI